MELVKIKYLLLCIVVLIPKTIFPQYFDNNIDLNISYNYSFPIGSKSFENNKSTIHYSESYMFTNQKHVFGFNFSVYYNTQKLSYGFEYALNDYTAKANNELFTRYNDVSLSIKSYRFAISTDILRQKKIINFDTKLKVCFKPQLSLINYTNKTETYSIQGITGTGFSIAPENIDLNDDLLNEAIYAPGFAVSAKLTSKLNQGIGLFFEYEFDLLFVNSNVYQDNLFFSNSLRFGFTLYLFKNKRYYYN